MQKRSLACSTLLNAAIISVGYNGTIVKVGWVLTVQHSGADGAFRRGDQRTGVVLVYRRGHGYFLRLERGIVTVQKGERCAGVLLP